MARHPRPYRFAALAALLLATFLVPSLRLAAQPAPRIARPAAADDRAWEAPVVRLEGNGGLIIATAVHGDDLYIAGFFDEVDGVPAQGIAHWDGERWNPLGKGIDGYPFVLVATEDEVWVGGIGIEAVDGEWGEVLRWNGSTWDAPGGNGNLSGLVTTILPESDRVYVGGSFDAIYLYTGELMPVNNVVMLDRATNAWQPLGVDSLAGVNNTVYDIERIGERVYVAGGFDSAAGAPARRLAAYDLTARTWSAVGDVAPEIVETRDQSFVHSLEESNGRLVAAGRIAAVDGVPVGGAAAYDIAEDRWSSLVSDPEIRTVSDLATHRGRIVGIAYSGEESAVTRLITFDESLASYALEDIDGSISGISADDELYLHGEFDDAGSFASLMHSTASGWEKIRPDLFGGASLDIADAARTESDIYLAGSFRFLDGMLANGIARWDRAGQSWHPLGVDSLVGVDGFVNDILLVGNDLYVGGQFTSAGGVDANNIAVYNTATGQWRAVPSAGGNGVSGRVNAIEVRKGVIYIGGEIDSVGTIPTLGLVYLNTEENILLPYELELPPLVTSVAVSTITAVEDTLFIGGRVSFGSLGGGTGIVRHSPEGSMILTPNGLNGSVTSIATMGGDLYMAGSFTEVEGTTAHGIARLRNGVWQPVGAPGAEGVTGRVDALREHDGRLYAAGSFDSAGTVAASNIARWDGTSWEALGSGTDEAVDVLLSDGAGVLVIGDFARAGGRRALQVARWNTGPLGVEADAHRSIAASIHPNPARDHARIAYTLARPSAVTITVVDLLGRAALAPVTLEQGSGAHMHTLNTSALAPGVYVVEVVSVEGRAAVRLVK